MTNRRSDSPEAIFSAKLIIVLLLLSPTIRNSRAERKSQRKCEEYGKLVYSNETAPVLKIGAAAKSVSKCGIVDTPLIVGGIEAKPLEFPHMAVIGYGNPVFWQCGGSIVSENWILTAAHCLESQDKGPPIKVRVGLTNIGKPEDSMQERNVKEKIGHPDYKLPSRYNDIALLKLDKPLVLGPAVRPACLQIDPNPPEKRALATGFGKTSYEANVGSNRLMKVTLDYVSSEECKKTFTAEISGSAMPQGLIPSILCAGVMAGGKDTCQGDSGGPLQRVSEKPYCTYSIVGVTSFGKFCAFKNSPAIYTRVSSYLDWLEGILWP